MISPETPYKLAEIIRDTWPQLYRKSSKCFENKYHRSLNISEYIPNVDFNQWNIDGCTWVDFHKTLKFNQLNNDKIEPWLNSLGLTTKWIEVFYTPPNDKGIIHSDNSTYDEWAKLIFQYGAVGSKMKWWKSDKTYKPQYQDNLLIASDDDCELIYETELSSSGLVNVGPLHSSYNPTNEHRFVVTIALFDMNYERILWDDAVNILSSYII